MSQTEIKQASRNTIGDALRRSVRRNPNREALLFEERSWTYAALNIAANRVAHAKAHIASFKVPKRVLIVESLPCTAAGKLLKRELRKQYATPVK